MGRGLAECHHYRRLEFRNLHIQLFRETQSFWLSVVMVVIVKEQLMVFFFLQMGTHECGKQVDHLFYLIIIKTRNEGAKQLLAAEQVEKKGQRTFIGYAI